MKRLIPIYLLLACMFSCDIKNNDISPDYNFVKVYDDVDISKSYYPVDAIETTDNGIIVLSAITDDLKTNYPTIHLLKTDSKGQVVWQTDVDPNYVSPVASLMYINNQIRFVCMDDNSFRTKVMSIDENTGSLTEVSESSESYPLAAHYSDETNSMVVLSYDGIGTNTVISVFDDAGNLRYSISTPTNKDFSYDIFQHLKKQGTSFPFYVNSFTNNNTKYYSVNAFSNYTLSLLFINNSSQNISGRINGYQELGGISSSIQKADNLFSIAESKFDIGEISLGIETAIDVNQIQNITELETTRFSELSTSSAVRIIKDEFNGKEMIVYCTTTKSNQIVLYFFDPETNKLIHTKYLGHTNPVEISSLFKANDDGIIITGKTWIAGRFQRVIIYKVATDSID